MFKHLTSEKQTKQDKVKDRNVKGTGGLLT